MISLWSQNIKSLNDSNVHRKEIIYFYCKKRQQLVKKATHLALSPKYVNFLKFLFRFFLF